MPDSGNHDQPASELEVADILDRYRQELRNGDDPDPEACLGAHPELGSELAECLEGLAAMEELRGALVEAPPPSPFAPRSLGNFQLLREIGRGGMGVVYEAIQTGLDRRVALKMIRAGALADGQDLEMFQKEARAAAALQHANIVQLHFVGEHEGQPYLVLEYVDGGSLDAKLAGTPIEPCQAAQLVATLALAMQHAHEHGIVHRDLKPANVLLTQNGTPKITDFGLAKHLHADAGQTQSATIKGTASYMASEQARGGTTTAATDVYALGAILYEALTGRPPFRGATPLDTLTQVTSLEPVPPSRLQPNVPRDLATICLTCLHKDPHKRYGSAQDLADELERFLRHEPIRARPVGVIGRVWRWCRRNPIVAATLSVAAALTALIMVLVVLRFVDRSARRDRILAENVFAANHLANTILVELWRLAEAVDQTASDPRLRGLLKTEDHNGLQAYFDEVYRKDPERKIVGANGKSAFHNWHVMNRKGILLADAPRPERDVFGMDFKGRDYFVGALRHEGDTGRTRIHVSRAFESLNDDRFKIALSAVVYDGPDSEDQVLGVVSATLPTNATLGSLRLDDSRRTAVLVGRRDTNLHDKEPPPVDAAPVYLILVHPAYGELPDYEQGKKAVRMPEEMLRLAPKRRPEDKDEFVPKPRSVVDAAEAVHDSYEDPLGKVHPTRYAGRWLAGFAPVGNMEMIVIVQQRREEIWPVWYWPLIGGVTLLAAGLFTPVFWRLRRRRAPPRALLSQEAPTISIADAPPRNS